MTGKNGGKESAGVISSTYGPTPTIFAAFLHKELEENCQSGFSGRARLRSLPMLLQGIVTELFPTKKSDMDNF